MEIFTIVFFVDCFNGHSKFNVYNFSTLKKAMEMKEKICISIEADYDKAKLVRRSPLNTIYSDTDNNYIVSIMQNTIDVIDDTYNRLFTLQCADDGSIIYDVLFESREDAENYVVTVLEGNVDDFNITSEYYSNEEIANSFVWKP